MNDPGTYRPDRPKRHRRFRIRGADYAVHEWGDDRAPMFVYLHGFADSGSTFQFVVDELTDDWFVVAPDWRGFGESRVTTSAFWFPDYLADLDQLLEQYSPGDPVRIVGHSMGGNVAGLYAGVRPGRVSALVNLEGFGLPDSAPDDAPARYRDWLARSREPAAATRRDSFEELARAILRRTPEMSPQQAMFVARCWARESADGGVVLRLDPAHKLPNPVLYRRAEAEACWQRVTAPVLLVAGRRSDYGPPDGLPFPRSKIAWIENSGHMLHFAQPAALARVIEEFLRDPSS